MNWLDLSVSKDEYYQSLSLMCIKKDCMIIKRLMHCYHDPIVSLGLMPYYALFSKETENYLKKYGVNINVQNNSPFKIDQTRLKLKQFNDRFSRASKYVAGLDESQDKLFKERIWLRFLRRFNIHNNLGIYYYENSIIGNTQLYYSFFQDRKVIKKKINGNAVNAFGEAMGKVVYTVSQLLIDLPDFYPNITKKDFDIYYQDINTNKKPIFRLEQKTPKSVALLLLHTLSSINFVRLIIRPIIFSSTWKMRVMYITMYYAFKQIELIQEKCGDKILNPSLTACIGSLNPIIDSEFRSCMMHYSFVNNGSYIIEDQYSDIGLPFYGLVESRFNGLSFDDLQYKVNENLDIMADSIEKLIILSTNNLKKL